MVIKQPRVLIGKHSVELVAGTLDDDDCFKNKARGEAFEETGIRFKKESLIDLGEEIYVSPGGSDETMKFFATFVENFVPPVNRMGKSDEIIHVYSMPLEEAYDNIKDGKFWIAIGKAKHMKLIA